MSTPQPPIRSHPVPLDAVIVGAGFAGIYMLLRLRQLGLRARVLEAGAGPGGTWYWNRYPGARCDVESIDYSYSFCDELQQDWRWSERYATQAEILRYVDHVIDRFGLRPDMKFESRVIGASWDDATAEWLIDTEAGEQFSARYLIMATGCLSVPQTPQLPGLDHFTGQVYSTGAWPHEPVDFTGLRVGVIGTGSSGIQSIPVIASQAAALTVFQRTPSFSVPAHNGPLSPEREREVKENYAFLRKRNRESRVGYVVPAYPYSAMEASPEEREAVYEERWQRGGLGFTAAYTDLITDRAANETAAEFVRAKIRDIVDDPATAGALQPRTYPIGTKRVCVDSGYYATYNLPHVQLVNLRQEPIVEVLPLGLRTPSREIPLDALVFATGFDAMTGALNRIAIRGRDGVLLRDHWAAGPRSYLGVAVAGFPNMFTITGPGSPSVLSNMMVSIEQHVDWMAEFLAAMLAADLTTFEATQSAQDDWVAHVNEVAAQTLMPQANSWYMGANVPGKPRIFMPYAGGVGHYRHLCADIAAQGYPGFVRRGAGE
ncbi:MAG: NAD(P)/FAD-dependent oxidoreductase [Thermomicrobiales bacterium]